MMLIYMLILCYTNFQEVDVVTTDAALFLARFHKFDVSIPLYTSGVALLVPWPDEQSRLLAPIHPFQPMVMNPTYYYVWSTIYSLQEFINWT